MHEIMVNLVKFYYSFGCYTNNDVAYFVKCNSINTTDYKEITGQDYPINQTV
ncbi:XkdX family protein [Lactobacillus sp. ESL0236]|nr:XkdX family protein [Lactobacillus sp. ESL0237]RMC43637.1 XkdX family protein [Lactobacillus sp. ESL0234]RMC45119.1 XkdX family protein [Lactobacillus sp. ESL0236]